MIVKGQPVKGGKRLATHLLKAENEVVNIIQVDGVDSSLTPEALRQSLIDMEDLGRLTQTQTGRVLYHANIDPRKNERLTPEQYIRSADMLMDKLGLNDQPRIIVEHIKNGRQHAHIVVQLTDIENGKVLQLGNNFYKQSAVAREIEKEFDLTRTPQRKTGHSYDMTEAQQIKKQGRSVKDYRDFLTNTYMSASSGKEFSDLLKTEGYIIAKGDRRGFVIIGKDGSPRSLSRDLKGTCNSKTLNQKLSDIDKDLPSVDQARKEVESLQVEKDSIALAYAQNLKELLNKREEQRKVRHQGYIR